MEFFVEWVVIPVLLLGLAFYFYKKPIDDSNPLVYILILLICVALKLGNFAKIIAN